MATTAIILETRRKNADGTHPVRLRITHDRLAKYVGINMAFTKEDFEKIFSAKPRNEFKEYQIQLNAIEKKATDILKDMPVYSYDKFIKEFKTKKSDKHNVFYIYQEQINKLEENNQPGTAETYRNSLNSLKKFINKEFLKFEDITVDFLNKYEKWAQNNGKSLTTVSIYVRVLRKLFNDAISENIINEEFYPFGKRGYVVPSSSNKKKALKSAELGKIFSHEPAGNKTEAFSKALWEFTFFGNGINMKDIARLKYKNMEDGFISFVRAKTQTAKNKEVKYISFALTDDSKAIIEKWGNRPITPDTYIFPILVPGITAKRERELIKQCTKTTNKYIQRIANVQEVGKRVTTYTARHSSSTALKQMGAPIEYIKDMLGHENSKTTEIYLDSFDDEIKQDWAAKLADFKNGKI